MEKNTEANIGAKHIIWDHVAEGRSFTVFDVQQGRFCHRLIDEGARHFALVALMRQYTEMFSCVGIEPKKLAETVHVIILFAKCESKS